MEETNQSDKVVVFLSSPGDVLAERNRLDDAVREVDSLTRAVGISVVSWRYDRDAKPEIGVRIGVRHINLYNLCFWSPIAFSSRLKSHGEYSTRPHLLHLTGAQRRN
jgi:hypothetical protein